MKQQDVILGEKVVASAAPIFVTAAIVGVESENPSLAFHLIDAAAECGADAVRFRTRRSEGVGAAGDSVLRSAAGDVTIGGSVLPWDDQVRLKQHAESQGVIFLSTPLDEESADFLDQLGVSALCVTSGDLTHTRLLRHIASKEKPVFLSTGMSYLNEVADAVWTLRSGGADGIVLMHSVGSRPADPALLNLRSLQTLSNHFNLLVGFADHSDGILYSITAAALGASVIEKHLALGFGGTATRDRAAVTPSDLRLLVRDLKGVKLSWGDGRKRPVAPEETARVRERRSVVAAVDIRAFERLRPWMLACKPPGSGLAPGKIDKLLGTHARRDIAKGTMLRWDDLNYSAHCGPEEILAGDAVTEDDAGAALADAGGGLR